MSWSALRRLRSTEVSMVYQDPVQAMNPALRIGRQVAESFRIIGQSKAQAYQSARDALAHVKIADPDSVMERYPHQLSGGMLQRVVIAMALAGDPEAARARRADDRPRRHRRSRGARSRADPARRDERRDPADRPQPRRHPLDVRSGRRHVRRQDRRAGRRPGDLRRAEASVHRRAAQRDPAARVAQDRSRAVHDPGQPAPDRRESADVCVRRPLPARRRDLPDARAARRAGRPGGADRRPRWGSALALDALPPPGAHPRDP